MAARRDKFAVVAVSSNGKSQRMVQGYWEDVKRAALDFIMATHLLKGGRQFPVVKVYMTRKVRKSSELVMVEMPNALKQLEEEAATKRADGVLAVHYM